MLALRTIERKVDISPLMELQHSAVTECREFELTALYAKKLLQTHK